MAKKKSLDGVGEMLRNLCDLPQGRVIVMHEICEGEAVRLGQYDGLPSSRFRT